MKPLLEVGDGACQTCGAVRIEGECPRCQRAANGSLGATYVLPAGALGIVVLGVAAVLRGLGSVHTLAPVTATLAVLVLVLPPLAGPLFRGMLGRTRLAWRAARARQTMCDARRGRVEVSFEGRLESLGPAHAPRLRIRGDGGVAFVDAHAVVLRRRGAFGLPGARAMTTPVGRRVRVVGEPRMGSGEPVGLSPIGYRERDEVVEFDAGGREAPLVVLDDEDRQSRPAPRRA